jgi:hypothetical protein
MEKVIGYFVLMLCAVQMGALSAQTPEKHAPPFTLELSLGHGDGTTPKNVLVLSVKITNISDHGAIQSFCGAIGNLYRLDVKLDGVAVPEGEWARKVFLYRKTHGCDIPGRMLDPGSSRTDTVEYYSTEPGSYEFTAIQDTDPTNPVWNETVKSNTLTVTIPEPKAPK